MSDLKFKFQTFEINPEALFYVEQSELFEAKPQKSLMDILREELSKPLLTESDREQMPPSDFEYLCSAIINADENIKRILEARKRQSE